MAGPKRDRTSAKLGAFQRTDTVFTIGDVEIPYVTGHKLENGEWSISVDHRFVIQVEEDQLQSWLWLMANAMAVAAGYTAHGRNNRGNPHNRWQVGIGEVTESEGQSGIRYHAFQDFLDSLDSLNDLDEDGPGDEDLASE